jgi:hypothetical protein
MMLKNARSCNPRVSQRVPLCENLFREVRMIGQIPLTGVARKINNAAGFDPSCGLRRRTRPDALHAAEPR